MSKMQFVLLVLILALSVIITRFLPFLIFNTKKQTPPVIGYLGRVLPAAMMGLLVVYCFKDTAFGNAREVLPLVASSTVVVLVHLWKRNTILSIVLGTAIYMILLRIS